MVAVRDGGPGDGQKHVLNVAAFALRIHEDDGSRHLYERVAAVRILPDGRRAVVFRWRGQY
jgi:hypothetical protein